MVEVSPKVVEANTNLVKLSPEVSAATQHLVEPVGSKGSFAQARNANGMFARDAEDDETCSILLPELGGTHWVGHSLKAASLWGTSLTLHLSSFLGLAEARCLFVAASVGERGGSHEQYVLGFGVGQCRVVFGQLCAGFGHSFGLGQARLASGSIGPPQGESDHL